MSVQSALLTLSSEAIPTPEEKLSIETSIATLCSRLSSEFSSEVIQQIRFGSSTRGTILPRDIDDRSDIDYMVVFRNLGLTPQAYLDRLKRFAEYRYSTSDIRQSSPSIVLELNHIRFDLVPAIQVPYSNSYQIPAPQNSYLSWIQTDPKGFNDSLTRKNMENASLIKPVIRLAKSWNVRAGRVYDSYALEQAIAGMFFYLTNKNLKDYFFQAMNSLTISWGEAQWRRDALDRAKAIINQTKIFEVTGQTGAAETEILKLF